LLEAKRTLLDQEWHTLLGLSPFNNMYYPGEAPHEKFFHEFSQKLHALTDKNFESPDGIQGTKYLELR
jgi:hypothetical protein